MNNPRPRLACVLCYRVHVPDGKWTHGAAITLDTASGAIDIEPPSAREFCTWLFGVNAAMAAAASSTAAAQIGRTSVPDIRWGKAVFVMEAATPNTIDKAATSGAVQEAAKQETALE